MLPPQELKTELKKKKRKREATPELEENGLEAEALPRKKHKAAIDEPVASDKKKKKKKKAAQDEDED